MFRPSRPAGRFPRRLAPAVAALSVLAAACGGAASDAPTAVPAADTTIAPSTGDAMSESDATSDAALASQSAPSPSDPDDSPPSDPAAPSLGADGDAALLASAKQRCVVGLETLERRVEAEGFEWPDEGPELSEAELQQVLTPEYPNVDGVAAPTDRAPIELIPAFDPETVPIPELDRLVGACIEGGVVTEAELFGDEGEDGSEGEEDWCAELADFDADAIAEFAADDGEDVVRSEFAECGLPDPLPA